MWKYNMRLYSKLFVQPSRAHLFRNIRNTFCVKEHFNNTFKKSNFSTLTTFRYNNITIGDIYSRIKECKNY